MPDQVSFSTESLLTEINGYLSGTTISVEMIEGFKENIVWKAIAASMKASRLILVETLAKEERYALVRVYQQSIHDIDMFLSIPDEYIKKIKLNLKEISNDSRN